MRNRMVIRLTDGEYLKGFSHDFSPTKRSFHLKLVDREGDTDETRQIRLDQADAIFFVRDFAFDRTDHLQAPPTDEERGAAQAGARAVRVKLRWGETLQGLTYGYDVKRPGFFVYPTAPAEHTYNLERVYVAQGAVENVEFD